MKEKFTKGEWKLWGERIGVVDDSDTQSYGMMMEVAYVDMYNFTSEECRANTHLIAAAPEMYKMLEACLSEMHHLIDEVNDQRASHITSTTENEPDYHGMQTLHEIQTLLKKARGE